LPSGDTLRETKINAVNANLIAMHQPKIIDCDHEAKLLPTGDTVVLASTPKIVNYKGRLSCAGSIRCLSFSFQALAQRVSSASQNCARRTKAPRKSARSKTKNKG
jgi:hypothetical protein